MSEEHFKKDNHFYDMCFSCPSWVLEYYSNTVLDNDRRVQRSLSQCAGKIVRGRKERVQGVCSVGRRGLHRLQCCTLRLLLRRCRTPLRLRRALERLKSNAGGGKRLFFLRRFKDRHDDYRQFDQGICGTFDVQLDLWKTRGHVGFVHCHNYFSLCSLSSQAFIQKSSLPSACTPAWWWSSLGWRRGAPWGWWSPWWRPPFWKARSPSSSPWWCRWWRPSFDPGRRSSSSRTGWTWASQNESSGC